MKNKNILGHLQIIMSSSLFGLMPLFAKMAYSYGATPMTVAFCRCFYATIILAVMLPFMKKNIFTIERAQIIPMLKIAIPFGLIPVALFNAYTHLDSGMATILFYTHPIFVMVLSILMYHTFPSKKQILCMILCLVGIVLLNAIQEEIKVVGIAVAILAGFIYSIYVIACGQKGIEEIDPTVLSFWINLFATIAVGIIGIVTGQLMIVTEPMGQLSMFVLALLVSVIAVLLFQHGVLVTGGLKASLLSTFEPLTSLFIGMIVFHELLTVRQWVGIVLVLVSVILLVIPVGAKKEK